MLGRRCLRLLTVAKCRGFGRHPGFEPFRPDNAEALAWGLREAMDSGPFSPAARQGAGTRFTVGQSVDTLLNVFAQPLPIPPASIVRQLEQLILAPSARR
jgi:D-inositol-3-phosphate glycosyltransferase